MAAQDKTKFFWIKLFTRFFDKHEIQILWGKNRDFVLLYIRLLLESVPNHGTLKYNSDLSYSTEDLAILFHMPEDVVSAGMKELAKRQLIVIEKDGTINVPAAPQMCGFDTGASIRMRDKRNGVGNESGTNVPECSQDGSESGTDVPRIQNSEFKDKNLEIDPPQSPPDLVDTPDESSVIFKGSDQFKHVSRNAVANYFKRMRSYGGTDSSLEIEEDFWQYLISVDFKKGDGFPIDSNNVNWTFKKWMDNRKRDERKEREEKDALEAEEREKEAREEAIRKIHLSLSENPMLELPEYL